MTTAVILGVHYMQKKEREVMRLGIERDRERMERRQRNADDLALQQTLREQLEKEQPITAESSAEINR